jgi:3-hydroxyacyl-CoA dehydrogenase
VLAEAQAGRWAELDALVSGFQRAMMAIKTAPLPVVAAPSGLTLGGGCELCLHASRIDAAAETYMGLSETSVGLIPAGGGTKEMLLRAIGAADGSRASSTDGPAALAAAFRIIAAATVSTSAHEARRLGYLSAADGITMHRERVASAARTTAAALARGYRPRTPLEAIPVGGASLFDALTRQVDEARASGRISDHDATIGRELARVFAGGASGASSASEQQLLDLEREAFLRLCGEPKTLERIAYTLERGTPLRN